MPFTRLDKSISLAELSPIIQCSGIWCAAGFQRWKPAMVHWSPLIIIADWAQMQYSLCFVETWSCIVLSLKKCLIVGNKRVVARGKKMTEVREGWGGVRRGPAVLSKGTLRFHPPSLPLFMVILWKIVYWTETLARALFRSRGLWAGSPAVKTQLLKEIKTKDWGKNK